ncbi:origin recognition complex subunit 3 N-terminus-domain-containing protein [Annulohypoxylon maeteangense]|uniref:origin recognition complex subunit 3 N-terminus-domain-containing protein n=1 Tax=Annulohypoxylon maeteangense TaxID=1927788 RepID=UPI00200769C8|nr:origin recognition complex subunit 3 N-terminus-domain-containing protein [Annulohypoxylon maeteangense]KAI0889963.1 origin recognition complex subunit 3 N-terminus-domain-containing protein [Annulohypoxylon maeteangense]
MAIDESLQAIHEEKQHQAAYVFDPLEETEGANRPAKRRRVSKKSSKLDKPDTEEADSWRTFQPLFGGSEDDRFVRLRQQLFEKSWSQIDERIQRILRMTNQSTLDEVTSFLQATPDHASTDKIPSAFIITGPNLASQDLLFEQLSGTLQREIDAKVVRLRSGDASNLKAVLKKIIHDVTARETNDEDDLELSAGKDGRKHLNYDLEALYVHLKSNPRRYIVIAFQDSEAFESGLLSDLISLFSSWLDRIPFALLFGVATSVELFQARLLKSTCQRLYGDQFDVEQSTSIIDKIFKAAIAHSEVPLRLGSSLVYSLLDRQREQVSSISVFVSSLKYAYMCHFYANPSTVFLSDSIDEEVLQEEHMETVRCLPSFRRSVETAIENGEVKQARLLLDDDQHLQSLLRRSLQDSRRWSSNVLRKLKILTASKNLSTNFTRLYLEAISRGIDSDQITEFTDSIKRAQPVETEAFLGQVLYDIKNGDPSLGLDPWASEAEESILLLTDMLAEVKTLQADAEDQGNVLRSKYSGQTKVLRTTVIAQKVQLSQDTAALTKEDKSYTDLMDKLVRHLEEVLPCDNAKDLCFSELWFFDSKAPYKDVFIPRPRGVIERALSRPHDYLNCSCCETKGDSALPSFPTTSVLYQLYSETGSLINIADLWSAYYAIVGEENEEGLEERAALVLFYRGLAEMREMGFVKQSRKKADHIAKLAWKGL